MNLFTGDASDTFFGGDVPPTVHQLLNDAREGNPATRVATLWSAQAMAPQCLAVYYALYKHHAGQREFDLAERAALRGLAEAARQAELPDDWRAVSSDHPVAGRGDFLHNGPARFWLFTMKALAFIALRNQRPAQARELLARLDALGPQAQVGQEVILALLDGVAPDASNPAT